MSNKTNRISPTKLQKWINIYHDMFVIAHNHLIELSRMHKLGKIKDKNAIKVIMSYKNRMRGV